jgi:hypothetical protein
MFAGISAKFAWTVIGLVSFDCKMNEKRLYPSQGDSM